MDKEKAKLEVGRLVEEFSKYPKEEIDSMKEEQIKFRFIEPLFEALGWERNDIYKEERVLKGRADYILRIGNQDKLVIEAKGTNIRLEEKEGRQAVSYAHHKNIKFSVLTNFKQIRVYHALSNIKNIDRNLLKDDIGNFWINCEDFVEQFDRLWLLSRESFEKEDINKLLKNIDKKLIKPIDESILADLLQFREWLSKDLKSKRMQLEDSQIDEVVQILIDRLIFMRSVEDRGLEGKDFLLTIIDSVEKRITDKNLWALLKEQFRRFDTTYNSKLFAEGLLEKEGAFADDVLIKTIKGLYYGTSHQQERYMFDEIPVDLLGSIYEQYLGVVLRGTEKRVKLDLVSGKRKKMGIYYTPSYIVEYIVKNTIGEYVKNKSLDEILDIKVVDPACGSGSFLINAFQELINIVEERLKKGEKSKEYKHAFQEWKEKLSLGEKATILTNCIYGVDLDEKAVELAQLNLLLKILEEETRETRKKILPNMKDNIKNGNSLISDSKFEKAFNWNAQFPDVFKDGGFDIVVGNPPYISFYSRMAKSLDKKTREYYTQEYFVVNNAYARINSIQLFFEMAVKICKEEKGNIGFIVDKTILEEKNNEFIREYLLKNTSILKIAPELKDTFGAMVDVVILILKKGYAKDIKTSWVNNSDINLKEEIIKINQNDFLKNERKEFSVDDLGLIGEKIEKGTPLIEWCTLKSGANVGGHSEKFLFDYEVNNKCHPVLKGSKNVERYNINWSEKDKNSYLSYDHNLQYAINKKLEKIGKDKEIKINLVKLGDGHIDKRFEKPKIIIRQSANKIIATYDEDKFYILYGLFLLNQKDMNSNLKYILAILNSKLLSFYALKKKIILTGYKKQPQIRSEGLKKIKIKKPGNKSQEQRIIALVEKMLSLQKKIHSEGVSGNEKVQIEQQIKNVDYEIDEEVYGLYGISEEEIKVVEGSLG